MLREYTTEALMNDIILYKIYNYIDRSKNLNMQYFLLTYMSYAHTNNGIRPAKTYKLRNYYLREDVAFTTIIREDGS